MQREYKISLSQEFYSDVVYLSQYDSDYNLVFNVVNKYASASVNGLSAKFTGKRPDGLGFEFSATGSGSAVTFAIDNTVSAVAGTGMGEIVFYDANGLYFGSANVQIIIEPAAHPNDTIDADVEEEQALADDIREMIDGLDEAVQTAEDARDEAVSAKNAAAASETSAGTDALKAEGYAVGTQDGTDVGSSSPYYQANAKYYKEQAALDKASADADALKAEGYAVGKQNGTDVSSGSDYYHNNAKYYKEQAAASATAAAASAASLTVDSALSDSSTNPVQNKVIKGELDGLKDSLIAISNLEKSDNLCDPSKLTSGLVTSNGDVSTADPSYLGYHSSDFIKVESGKTYCFTSYISSTGELSTLRKAYNCYDANKDVVPYSYYNQTNINKVVITIPNGVSYIRVSAGSTSDICVILGDTAPENYINYFEQYYEITAQLGETPIEQIKAEVGNDILSGKKWAHCGDSFSHYTDATYDSGVFNGQFKTFPRLIALRRNMTLYSVFFNSGRTLAFPATPGSFVNSLTNPSAPYYYQNIPADSDYITIYLGINDSHHAPNSSGGDGEDNTGEIPIGTLDDADATTFGGAWNVVLSWLIANRPNAHIGIIISNGVDSVDYRTMTINAAKKYGLPYLDLNGDDRTPAMLRTVNPDIASSVKTALITKWAVDPTGSGGTIDQHPNYQAHEYESTFIEAFLRSI